MVAVFGFGALIVLTGVLWYRWPRFFAAGIMSLVLIGGQKHRIPNGGDAAQVIDMIACVIIAWLISGLPAYFRRRKIMASAPTLPRLTPGGSRAASPRRL